MMLSPLWTVSFFIAAMRKMSQTFKQIPILKKSEKLFCVTYTFYTVFLVMSFCDFVWILFVINKPFNPKTIVSVQSMISLALTMVNGSFTLMVGWIALRYNQPLMTRRDLRTGQKVSLLIFIRSKYDM